MFYFRNVHIKKYIYFQKIIIISKTECALLVCY